MRGRPPPLRQVHGEGPAAGPFGLRRKGGREADTGDRHNTDPGGGGQDRYHRGTDTGPEPHREEGCGGPQGALPGPDLRHKGRGHRRRALPGLPHVGHRPAFHRGHTRGILRAQPAVRRTGEPHRQRQRPGHRPNQGAPEEGHGHELQGAPRHSRRPGGEDHGRDTPGERLPHNVRIRDIGNTRPVVGPGGPEGKAREDGRGLHLRFQGGDRQGPWVRRGHDDTAEGRHRAEPGADPGGPAGFRARVPLRQHPTGRTA